MVADGYTCTLRPILAPKQRSRNRLQPKQGLGLNRKSGCASVHNTRRVSSAEEYFRARRFLSTFSMRKTTKYEVHDYGKAGLYCSCLVAVQFRAPISGAF